LKNFSRKELGLIRKEKLRKEIASAKRLLNENIEPLQIADEFLHGVIILMQDEIYRTNPNLNQKEILQKLRDNAAFLEKLKKLRKRGRNFWLK